MSILLPLTNFRFPAPLSLMPISKLVSATGPGVDGQVGLLECRTLETAENVHDVVAIALHLLRPIFYLHSDLV